MTDTLSQALYWLDRGIAPIPIRYRDKTPLVKWAEYQTELPSRTTVKQWFSAQCNIAIITGHRGLTVIDFDDMPSFNRWRIWATRRDSVSGLISTQGYRVSTSRGVHVYVRLRKPTRTRSILDADGNRTGVDVKSTGGYVIVPPSIHPSGVEYTCPNPRAMVLGVKALSDILPADLLTLPTNTEYEGVELPRAPRPKASANLDPWATAENPQIDADLIDAIRERFTIAEMFKEVWKTGDGWLITRCPLHNDRKPSMWIDERRGICGCYAGCTQKPLDVINLYAELLDLSNDDAIASLGKILRGGY